MKITPIKQRDEDACGPTCIEMALQYFKLPYSFDNIATVSDYRKEEGLDNNQLVAAIQQLGLKVTTHANATWEDLEKYNTDDHVIILSWMLKGYIGHFSVLEKVDATDIYLADPEVGEIIKIEKIEFLRLWLDYGDSGLLWYPEKNTDIQLRWMAVVSR